MGAMRTPDEDGALDGGEVSGSVGDGFGSSAGDLTDGFGEDDFSDDNTFDTTDTGDSGDTTTTGDGSTADGSTADGGTDDGGTSFGDGLSDAEAENVLVEILEDVFGDDAPEVLQDMEAATGLDGSELYQALDEADASDDAPAVPLMDEADGLETLQDDAYDPYDPAEAMSRSDFDLTGDGHVDHHDLHEAAHPFDFDISN